MPKSSSSKSKSQTSSPCHSPGSALSSAATDEDVKSTSSKVSWRRKLGFPKPLSRPGSPDSEKVQHAKEFICLDHTAKCWKEKISNHVAPPEQEERYVRTQERVRDVVQNILGYGSNATRDVLEISSNLLTFAPVTGLSSAARTLVFIWNALELVESNQLACLSLTERCVDTLIILRDEINQAGESIERELRFPLMQLNDSFNAVKKLLEAQAHRPFYKRYLRRREIQKEIEACDAKLSNALELFSLKIQIRSLHRMEEAERRRRAGELRTRRDLEKLLESLPAKVKKQETLALSQVITAAEVDPVDENGEPGVSETSKSETLDDSVPEIKVEGPEEELSATISKVREKVDDLVLKKNNRDFALDLAELRNLMREAVEYSTDEALLDLLQIRREELPEVLRELQRALEEVKEEDDDQRGEPREPSSHGPSMDEESTLLRAAPLRTRLYEEDISDELDRAFIEQSIKALKRRKSI